MSKLIGTNPNQVPSNADLGTAAFMDSKDFLLSKGSDLSAVNAIINESSVNGAYVYDTTTDSDGGAWRKRTQYTSWYNERLNTATRGSRREFPSVAVIAWDSNKVTIYDADDPSLPMWMVFEKKNIIYTGITRALAINGILYIATNPSTSNAEYWDGGLKRFRFIDEYVDSYSYGRGVQYNVNIAERNTTNSASFVYEGGYNSTCAKGMNVSVMDATVLPNSSIEPSTGLPRPTVAIGTEGGVTVINHDDTIADITYTSGGHISALSFTPNNKLIFNADFSGAAGGRYVKIYDIPGADLAEGAYNNTGNAVVHFAPSSALSLSHDNDDTYFHPRDFVFSKTDLNMRLATGYQYTWAGLTKVYDYMKERAALVAGITSSYNSGWMPGEIRGAWLASTDVRDVVGTNLVSNGDFSNGTTGWDGSSASLSVNGSGQLVVTGTATSPRNQNGFQNAVPIEPGRKYILEATIVSTNESGAVGFNLANAHFDTGNGYKYYGGTFPKTVTETITTTGSLTMNIGLHAGVLVGAESVFDNVTLKLAEEDRSHQDHGLEPFGILKKEPVSAGAELVSYTGFNQSNYLKCANHSDLNVGTDDFMFMFWGKASSLPALVLWCSLANPTSNDNRTAIYTMNNGQSRFFLRTNGTEDICTSSGTLILNKWTHLCGVRRGTVLYLYQDGELVANVSTTKDITQAGQELKLGVDWDLSAHAQGNAMTLFRFSRGNVPDGEQIKHIYETEKEMFKEGAKITIYGSSDDVRDLDVDQKTDLLHVGTSSGRSVFQGLRRVDHTTNAITSTVSAYDGLVVEE